MPRRPMKPVCAHLSQPFGRKIVTYGPGYVSRMSSAMFALRG